MTNLIFLYTIAIIKSTYTVNVRPFELLPSKRYILVCAHTENSDRPALRSESWVGTLWVKGSAYLQVDYLRLCSDCADAQTDLNLR